MNASFQLLGEKLKNYLRSTILQRKLNDSNIKYIINIYRDVIEDLDIDILLNIFYLLLNLL